MKQLENTKGSRLRMLSQYDPDTAKAYRWLLNNKDIFVGRVYGPVALLLDIKDPKYASQVEYALGGIHSSNLKVSCIIYKRSL